jgi:Cu+-exporting ATPase
MSVSLSFQSLRQPLATPNAVCRHCGDPCRDEGISNTNGTFCCTGCEAVFSLIAGQRLTDFYACEVPPGRSQRGVARGQDFAVLESPDVIGRLVEDLGHGRVAATLSVPAIHCGSCVWLLEQLWRFDPAIGRSEVDLFRHTVRVEFQRDRTSLSAIAAHLAALGYPPVVDTERSPARMPAARRDLYLRIGVAGFAFGNMMLFSVPRYLNGMPLDDHFQRLFDALNVVFAIPVLVYSAAPYFRAARAALAARTMVLEVPIAAGLAVLFGRSLADILTRSSEGFLDSFAGLVFFLLIGRLFQQRAFDRIAFDRTIRSFLPLSVLVDDGTSRVPTPIDQLRIGDVMVIRPHEVVPADALFLDVDGVIDYAFATGESRPVAIEHGASVQAGGRVLGHAVRLAVVQRVSQSKLVDLWNNPIVSRPKPDRLSEVTANFSRWFVRVVIGLALVGGAVWWSNGRRAAEVVTAVLIIACPCALTLAAPLTLGTGVGQLGRVGLFLKRVAAAHDLGRVDTIVFDKTGTLTARAVSTSGAQFAPGQWQLIRRLAAESVHPVSIALAAGGPSANGPVDNVQEIAGHGIGGDVDGHRVVIGTRDFVAASTGRPLDTARDTTWAAVDATVGPVHVLAEPRPGIRDALLALGARYELWLLTGDRSPDESHWRDLFGDQVRYRQSPDQKLAAVQELQAAGRHVLMIGDGLNDAGALAAADVGLAVSDDAACLVPACDGVLRGDRVVALPLLLRYARLARRVVWLCFVVSVGYNVLGVSFALAGRLTPLVTAILMPVSSLTIVALSVGLMRIGARAVAR